MADERAQPAARETNVSRMSNEDYFRSLDAGALARTPEEVARIRAEVARRWRGDPRADDLTEALYAHEERLARATRGGIAEQGRSETRRPT